MSTLSVKERMKQKKKELEEKNNKGDFFFIKEGTTRMRPLPVPEEQTPYVEGFSHYLGKDLGGIPCPRSIDQDCAICDAAEEFKESHEEEDQELYNDLRPKKKAWMPHIKYKDEKGGSIDDQAGIRLLQLTNGQLKDLIDFYLDEDESPNFGHPKKGYDIKYGRTGTGITDTEYTVRICKPTKLPEKYWDELYDPIEMLKKSIPNYEKTKEILNKFLKLDPEKSEKKKKKKKKKNKNKI